MKKIISFICICLLAFTAIIPVSANEENYNEDNAIIEFTKMQDDITNSMSIIDNRYSYDYDIIRNIVYGFDFEPVNVELGTNYTREWFLNEAIRNIENTSFNNSEYDFNICLARSVMCGENWSDGGWNYSRAALDDDKTTAAIYDCRNWAVIVAAGGAISGGATAAVPPLSLIMLASGTLASAYYTMLSNNLTSKQIQAHGCGVVLDMNKFTFVYSIWTQPEF